MIETDWNTIETSDVVAGAAIQSEDAEGRYVLANLNALDEALANRACPGSSGQTFYGHDHALEGGGPIIRGMVWSADGGSNPIKTFNNPVQNITGINATVITPESEPLGYMNASPGLNPDGLQKYRVSVRYKAVAVNWLLSMNSDEPVLLETFPEGDTPRWATLYGWIPTDDWLSLYSSIVARVEKADTAAELKIYGLIIWETYDDSQYHPGVIDVENINGGYESYSWPGAKLAKELVTAGDSLDALTYANAVMRANAIYEHLMDRPALGTGTQRLQGHDHQNTGYGGRSIPMGCIYSCRAWEVAKWAQNCAVVNTWYYFDQGATGQRRTTAGSTPGGTITTLPMFIAPVSTGFTSTGNPPTTAPYLIGSVTCAAFSGGNETVQVRIYNMSTGTYSSTATLNFSAAIGTRHVTEIIEKIPCQGGIRNRFAIEVRCTTNPLAVSMFGCQIFEIGEYSGTNRTYIASTGNGPLDVANEFRRP